jgi:hypothetical protein
MSTMTMASSYVTTILIYSTGLGVGGDLNSTQITSTSIGAIYTGKANRVQYGFLGWILGILNVAML